VPVDALPAEPGWTFKPKWDGYRNEPYRRPSYLAATPGRLAGPPPAEPAAERGSEPQRVRVEMHFRSLGAAQTLLAFGADAEVLTPPELRRILARKAAETAALYAATGH
jgi:predicted DNA-binding transcriptional regulator YafY